MYHGQQSVVHVQRCTEGARLYGGTTVYGGVQQACTAGDVQQVHAERADDGPMTN